MIVGSKSRWNAAGRVYPDRSVDRIDALNSIDPKAVVNPVGSMLFKASIRYGATGYTLPAAFLS
jgi:hypothetical protein